MASPPAKEVIVFVPRHLVSIQELEKASFQILNGSEFDRIIADIKEGNFKDLAERVYCHLLNTSLLVLSSQKRDNKIREELLDTMIDLWFDRGRGVDPNNWQQWIGKDELFKIHRELNQVSAFGSFVQDEARLKEDIREEITTALIGNLQDSTFGAQANEYISTTDKKTPLKRTASSEIDEEWASLLGENKRTRHSYDCHYAIPNHCATHSS